MRLKSKIETICDYFLSIHQYLIVDDDRRTKKNLIMKRSSHFTEALYELEDYFNKKMCAILLFTRTLFNITL